jgi:hypothetical protein
MSLPPASKIPVYGLMGHGCLYHDEGKYDQFAEVPPGVIWIENSTCGMYAYARDHTVYSSSEIAYFLTHAPLPTSPETRSTYQAELDRLTSFSVRAHFPGDLIGNGINTLFLQYPDNRISISGIVPLYIDTSSEIEIGKIREASSHLTKDDIDYMYKYSIKPTKEEAWDLYSKNKIDDLNIAYDTFFKELKDKAQGPKHVVYLQMGCRSDCTKGREVKTPSPLRTKSEHSIITNIKTRTPRELIVRKLNGKTKLMELLEAGYDTAAEAFITILKSNITDPVKFQKYLNTVSYELKTALDYTSADAVLEDKSSFREYLVKEGAVDLTATQKAQRVIDEYNISSVEVRRNILLGILKLEMKSVEEFAKVKGAVGLLLDVLVDSTINSDSRKDISQHIRSVVYNEGLDKKTQPVSEILEKGGVDKLLTIIRDSQPGKLSNEVIRLLASISVPEEISNSVSEEVLEQIINKNGISLLINILIKGAEPDAIYRIFFKISSSDKLKESVPKDIRNEAHAYIEYQNAEDEEEEDETKKGVAEEAEKRWKELVEKRTERINDSTSKGFGRILAGGARRTKSRRTKRRRAKCRNKTKRCRRSASNSP